ncbi:MAG: NAD(+) diphosphatase [Chloroflexota bacterium]
MRAAPGSASGPHVFSSNPLDRVGGSRGDEAWLRSRIDDPRGRYLPFRELKPGVRADEGVRLGWLDRETVGPLAAHPETVLLGVLDDVPHFALHADGVEAAAFEALEYRDARGVAMDLAATEAGMLAQGRSMLEWHATNRFCPQCGSATTPIEGGARRLCAGCAARSYPRVSPSMIVLVEREDRCLLARRRNGPPNRFSCLAGYLETGESIEDAVVREVFEESGVRVDEVRYHSSQPWPFPATLMIGCFAQATAWDIEVDGTEIAEARWVTRDEARRALEGSNPDLAVPDRIAIAHHLIRAWIDEGDA